MGAKEVRAGGAYVEVSTKDKTAGGLDAIKTKLKSFASTINRVGGVAVAGAAAAITAATMKAINAGAAINDLAQRYGISAQAVQALSYAAEQSGTDLGTVITGLKNLQKGIGGGTLGDELSQLGLSLADLRGKSPEEQLAMVAAAFGKITDQEKKMAIAMKLFGKSGSDLVPMLHAGADGAAAMMKAFNESGMAMGDEAVKQAAELDDQINKLGMRFESLGVQLGTALIPTLQKLIDMIPSPSAEYGAAGLQDLIEGGNSNLRGVIQRSNAKATATAQRAYDEAMEGKRISEERRLAREAGAAYQTPMELDGKLTELIARSDMLDKARANSREAFKGAGESLKIFDGVIKEWNRIGRSVDREQNKEHIREQRGLQADLADVNRQIAAEMGKTVSFGSFDKRDLMGGVFNDIGHQQLKELRESKKLLEKQLAALMKLKPGLPVG